MFLNAALSLATLAGMAIATLAESNVFGPDAIAACGETAARICFGADGGTSQDIEIEDIEYAASSLRFIGQSNNGSDALWTSAYLSLFSP